MPPKKKAKGAKSNNAVLANADGFNVLPMDIFFEICSLLDPLDLLHLSRINKTLRQFLLNRANVAIWRSAFAITSEQGGPPGCPSYMSEPAWAHVAFEKACSICFANLRDNPNLDSVWWEFGARYCGTCMKSEVANSISVKVKRLVLKRSWDDVFPRARRVSTQGASFPAEAQCKCSLNPGSYHNSGWYYLGAHQRELTEELMKTEDEGVREAIIDSRAEQTRLVMEHSKQCREWAARQIQQRQIQASQNRRAKEEKVQAKKTARRDEIVAKLNALGWSDEPWMYGGRLSIHIRNFPNVSVPRKLTAKEYRELEPALVAQLTSDRRKNILRRRTQAFYTAFKDIITPKELQDLALCISPSCLDVVLIPEVRELLTAAGDVILETDELTNAFRPIMPTTLKTWADNALVQISEYARECFGIAKPQTAGRTTSKVPDPLELAIAFVGCPRGCGMIMHFPGLLKHKCGLAPYYSSATHANQEELTATWLCSTAVIDKGDEFEAAARSTIGYSPGGYGAFSPSVLGFKQRLDALKGVVRAYGRDPKTATASEMADEKRLVRCKLCVAKAEDPRELLRPGITADPMDWLAAMKHSVSSHWKEPDERKIEWEITRPPARARRGY